MLNQCQNRYGIQWNITGPGRYMPCGQTTTQLPAGGYSAGLDHCGNTILTARHLEIDELIDFSDSLPDRILQEVARFWDMGATFRRHGFLHRRGYLFHGRQGCGKSALIHQIAAGIIAQGHVVFFCENPWHFVHAVSKFRQVEPQRPMVCVFEDIDAIIKVHGDSELLQWLDGNYQVDQAINLASTNYPERLDPRIIARPRRFDRVLRIESPGECVRDAYFARKLPELSATERAEWVRQSDGLPFAALAEMVISVCCLGNDLEATSRTLRELDAHFAGNPGQLGGAEAPAEAYRADELFSDRC